MLYLVTNVAELLDVGSNMDGEIGFPLESFTTRIAKMRFLQKKVEKVRYMLRITNKTVHQPSVNQTLEIRIHLITRLFVFQFSDIFLST